MTTDRLRLIRQPSECGYAHRSPPVIRDFSADVTNLFILPTKDGNCYQHQRVNIALINHSYSHNHGLSLTSRLEIVVDVFTLG